MVHDLAFFIIVLIASYFLFSRIEAHFDTQFNGLTELEARDKQKTQNMLSFSFAIMETITSSVCAVAFAVVLSLNLGFVSGIICLAPIIEVLALRCLQFFSETSKKWIIIRLTVYIIVIFFAAILAFNVCDLILLLI